MTAREDGTIPADRVVDVQYGTFMADPFPHDPFESTSVSAHELTSDAEARRSCFLAENRADKHGAHEYSFSDTGLGAGGRVRAGPPLPPEYFDVPSEPLR